VRLDETGPANRDVLRLVRSVLGDRPVLAAHDSVADPYSGQGSHPDVVERVWDGLGKALPADCRCLVLGTPALVHPDAGVVLAFSLGTRYYVRRFSEGGPQHAEAAAGLGPAWAPGDWSVAEADRCAALYAELGRAVGRSAT
jgi:hypothetical protein